MSEVSTCTIFLNCIAIPRRHSDAESLLDLAEVADRFHLPTIQTQAGINDGDDVGRSMAEKFRQMR